MGTTFSSNAINRNEFNEFFEAADTGDLRKVTVYLRANRGNHDNINASFYDQGRLTALMVAVARGHTQIVEQILDALSTPNNNATDVMSRYESEMNTQSNLIASVKMAIRCGDSIDESILRKILSVPFISPNAKNMAIHFAVIEGSIKSLNYLLTLPGININHRDDEYASPLHYAVLRDETNFTLRLLADPRININAVDEDGHTPLHEGVRIGNVENIKCLLKGKKINVNAVTPDKWTPLEFAEIRLIAHDNNISIAVVECLLSDKRTVIRKQDIDIIESMITRRITTALVPP